MIILVIIELILLIPYFYFRRMQLNNSDAIECDLIRERLVCALAAILKAIMFIIILLLMVVGQKFLPVTSASYMCSLINLAIMSIILVNGFIAYFYYQRVGFWNEFFSMSFSVQRKNGGRAIDFNDLMNIYNKQKNVYFSVSPKGYGLIDAKSGTKENIHFNTVFDFFCAQLLFYLMQNHAEYEDRLKFV